MAHLQPASQESERLTPFIPLGVTAWVVVFGLMLCVVAGLVLRARGRTIERAATVASVPRPESEVSHVRTALFSERGAGERLKRLQRERLEHYAWVDRRRGVVKIPIDVAIGLELEEHAP
jgi:hypothetical protein